MVTIKYLIFLSLLISSVYAETKKVYFYTTESNINDFKSLKINFDGYLKYFGKYNFQAFTKKDMFEKYLEDSDIIVILSSWHYKQIAKKYNLKPKLVAFKGEGTTSTKVLIGKKGLTYEGTVTTTFSNHYAQNLVDKLVKSNNLKLLAVPKEIDALMSVGFGMSKFALVSRDSFELLKEANVFLANKMKIYQESLPNFRMLVASSSEIQNQKLVEMFTSLHTKSEGQKILGMLGIDDIVVLSTNDLKQLGGVR